MYDIIIVGAGPAGLTASIYAKRASKKVLVLEARTYGGQIINAHNIENYPVEKNISGFDFATKLYNQVKDLGAEIKFEQVINIKDLGDIKEVETTDSRYQSRTVILATGADNRKLNLENEKELTGKGISYCATCDGNFYKEKVVAVVGGGNTAVEDALYLSDIVKKVYLIHRRDEFRSSESTLDKLKNKENVEFIYKSNITKLNGTEKLESIEVIDKDNNKKDIKVDGLFIAVGRVPSNENFRDLIKMDDKGYIIAKEDCYTNTEGIFAAGDSRTKSLRQLVTATSDGAIAATEAVKYINNNDK